jgi:hypothetical protein
VGTVNSFLILIGGFVIFLIVYFQSSRKKQYPTKLDMKRIDSPITHGGSHAAASEAVVLNIMFNYNGHSFDAYQALGIPAGSTWPEVKAAFDKCLDDNDPSAKEFYLTAFNAIKARQNF